jgi:hypothetical protein
MPAGFVGWVFETTDDLCGVEMESMGVLGERGVRCNNVRFKEVNSTHQFLY